MSAENPLTERERWLVEQAYEAGTDAVLYTFGMDRLKHKVRSCQQWLDELVADGGVTVDMVLCKEAPK